MVLTHQVVPAASWQDIVLRKRQQQADLIAESTGGWEDEKLPSVTGTQDVRTLVDEFGKGDIRCESTTKAFIKRYNLLRSSPAMHKLTVLPNLQGMRRAQPGKLDSIL